MADKKVPATANKMAMSRALGAAFLNHQVEQLEKSVSNGPASGNWRDRRQAQANAYSQLPQKRPPQSPAIQMANRKKTGEEITTRARTPAKAQEWNNTPRETVASERNYPERKDQKQADIIIADASVLVHALYQLKKWCRDGRDEIIIVPLEALNTLDLLKKGTTPLAQRARAASRILEAQVGTNPRIRVQRDDAFVLWDKIAFGDSQAGTIEADNEKSGIPLSTSPEWVRRTICCARWEVDNNNDTVPIQPDGAKASEKPQEASGTTKPKLKVVLAVISSTPNLSPYTLPLKLADVSTDVPLTPVPLPAPSLPHANKNEVRAGGSLVAHWAARAGIKMLQIDPTNPAVAAASPGRVHEDDDLAKRPHHPHPHPHPHSHGTRGRQSSHNAGSPDGGFKVGLVERPPAVMAMMEMVAQPSKVVRVLARGEKLDPDP